MDLQGCCRARENQWGAEEERRVGAGVAEPDKHTRDHVGMPMYVEGSAGRGKPKMKQHSRIWNQIHRQMIPAYRIEG